MAHTGMCSKCELIVLIVFTFEKWLHFPFPVCLRYGVNNCLCVETFLSVGLFVTSTAPAIWQLLSGGIGGEKEGEKERK